jgi:endonuclease/exonuclease/phosphatase family metal-dependent hydrolase
VEAKAAGVAVLDGEQLRLENLSRGSAKNFDPTAMLTHRVAADCPTRISPTAPSCAPCVQLIRTPPIVAATARRLVPVSTAVFLLLAAAAPTLAVDLRVVTYNIHSGLGPAFALRSSRTGVERNLRAIGETIAATTAAAIDVVGLNEVDFASRRSAWIDQAAFLADDLERRTGERYAVVRGETWQRTIPGFEVRFGNAALVRHPIVRSTSCLLDEETCDAESAAATGRDATRPARGFFARWLRETRGVIAMTLDVGGRPLDVRVTHLDAFVQGDREAQASRLVERLVGADRSTLLLGDMNAVPSPLVRPFFAGDRTGRILTGGLLTDVRSAFAEAYASGSAPLWPTFPAAAPRWPLDWVLGTSDLVPTLVKTVGDRQSDHRGLYVQFDWPLATPAEHVRAAASPAG